VGEHQIKVDANDEYWRRFQNAKAAGMLTNPSGLAKVALSHAMENGQAATEALLRASGNGGPAIDHLQLGRIEERLTDHQREHQLGRDQDENRGGCIEVWLKVLTAVMLVSVMLTAYLAVRQPATA
jgi:hypothetical protein